MRILKANFDKGFATLRVTNNDDVWCLKGIIEPGDFIKARTLRSLFITREGKKEKIGKKPMTLKIQAEKIELEKYRNVLRVTGKIVEGPEEVQIGSYHTIEIKVSSTLTIFKEEWRKLHIEKLKKAEVKVPQLLLIALDSSLATFALLKKDKVDVILELNNPHPFHEEEKQIEFYKKIASEIMKKGEKVEKIIIAGPGFAKEHVKKILEEKYPEIKEKLMIDSVSSATIAGINEIFKRGTLDKVLKESEILKESNLVREFFIHLNKNDGLVSYGIEDLKKANSMGAIKILLVSEDRLRENEVEKLAEEVEKKGGKVEIISTTHELGEEFYRLGGLGAILRFRVDFES